MLCGLLVEYFKKEIDELHANHVCVRALGVQAPFPLAVREAVQEAERRTANNTGLKLNIALNYGAQNEWVRATQAIAQKVQTGALRIEDITETALADHLDTRGLPAVDLVIRTSGEQRLSNFMLYQAAYAELLFVKEGWPDFSLERYTAALQIFLKRTRRYGGL